MDLLRENIRRIVEGCVREYILEKSKKKNSGKKSDNNIQRAIRHLNDPKVNATALGVKVCDKDWDNSTVRSYMSKLARGERRMSSEMAKEINNAVDKM